MLGKLEQAVDDQLPFDNNNNGNYNNNNNDKNDSITDAKEPENSNNLDPAVVKSNNERTFDILAYHKGREKYDLRNMNPLLLDDTKSMTTTVTIEIPLSSAADHDFGDEDVFRETIEWDLSNITMPTPIIVATQIGEQFGLTYPMIWDLAHSIQLQLQNFVNDHCTYTEPTLDDPPASAGCDHRKPVTTVPQLYGAVTGFAQVGGTCTAPVSRCKPAPLHATSSNGDSLATADRSLSNLQRSTSSGGSYSRHPPNPVKSRVKIDPALEMQNRRVVPKLPMLEFPKEVSQGMDMDSAFDMEYRTLFTAEGSFLVTNDTGVATRDISRTEDTSAASPMKPSTAPQSESLAAPFVEDGSVDFCNVCKTVGNLLCCDFCPRAFHCHCISSDAIPESMNDESKWECPSCILERNGLPDDHITETPMFDKLATMYNIDLDDTSAVQHVTVLSLLHEMLRKLMQYDFGDMFRSPVDCREIPTYKTIVKNPMDLGTITKNLERGQYKSKLVEGIVLAVLKDVELVWHNCFIFNVEGSAVYRMANIQKRRAVSIRQCSFDHLISDRVKNELSSYVSTLELERDNHRRLDALTMIPGQLTSAISPSQSRHKISMNRSYCKSRPVAILDADSGRVMKIYSSMLAATNAVNFICSLKRHECEWEMNEIDTSAKVRTLMLRMHTNPNLRLFGYRWVCLDELRERRIKFASRTATTTQGVSDKIDSIPEQTLKQELIEVVSESKSVVFYSIDEALSFWSLPNNTKDLRARIEGLVSGTDFEAIDGNMWKRSDLDDFEACGIEFTKEDTVYGDAVTLCGFVDILAAHNDWSQTLDASVGSNEESRSLDIFSRLYLNQDRTVDGIRWRRLQLRVSDNGKNRSVVESKSVCESTINTSASASGIRQDTSSTDTQSTNNSNASHVYDLETVSSPLQLSSPNRKPHGTPNFTASSKCNGFNDLESNVSAVPISTAGCLCDSAVNGTIEASDH